MRNICPLFLIMKDDYKGLDFGSYCTIEMFRHGADNEFYTHKVIGRLNSNAAIAVPIKYGIGGTGHEEIIGEEIVPCLKVVCQGIDETKVFKVRVSDVSPQIKSDFSGSYAPIP